MLLKGGTNMSIELKDVIQNERLNETILEYRDHLLETYDNSYKGEPVTISVDLGEPDGPVEFNHDNKIDAIMWLLKLNGIINQENMINTLKQLTEGFINDLKSR